MSVLDFTCWKKKINQKMGSPEFENRKSVVGFLILLSSLDICLGYHVPPLICKVSVTPSCPASLYYVSKPTKTLQEVASLFRKANVLKQTDHGFLIGVICSCQADTSELTWRQNYTVQAGDTWNDISIKFGSFVVQKQAEEVLIPSKIVTLDLSCACSGTANVVTYRVERGDTLFTIVSLFKASVKDTIILNSLKNPDLMLPGDVLYIPAPAIQNISFLDSPANTDLKPKKAPKSMVPIVVGSCSAVFAVALVSGLLVFLKKRKRKGAAESEESKVLSWNSDKATILPYSEIREATSNFSASLKIGQGSYGSVYLGKIRGTYVAVKQMKNTKSKEFLSELNVLCKVHHTNLIELTGYASGGDSLFLVYEYAQKGALSEHIHKPSLKGHKPLPWTTRVQIAVDAAKGLEYIHEHTKPFCVHRDVKTSNILLDSNFRAKIADFGLAKFLENSPEVAAAASRIVGTFGYLAPEYARNGCVTTKSDVYSFGVVLMELLTGQPALTIEPSSEQDGYSQHRSLVHYVLSALNDTRDPFNKLIECIDPNLSSYHKDSVFQMALLAKECANDDWNRRPDMSRIVLHLSQILICSKEWQEQELNHIAAD